MQNVAFTATDISLQQTTLDTYLNEYIAAYEKEVADKKMRGIMKSDEGRKALPLAGYLALNKAYINWDKPSGSRLNGLVGIMCWCISVLCWVLITRSESIDIMHLVHIDWKNDGMEVNSVKSKKDQVSDWLNTLLICIVI